ncbi:MAG: bifunctional 4-hydroxy-2-oxoglutarate aldolase/2-dehydro-3-deoxy-phosphogluconate aldolase [Clostridia bacterium]|nr:bifunctional 4-hydroxy-2-oxoglutarate aldolase/2-dehydro-3-deoxy-phosphogluconate aldolase [Clostridia bacterium]
MENIIERIEKEKIITIVRGIPREKLLPLAQAMYDGGIRLIECTYDASQKVSNTEIASNIELLVNHFGNKMIVGAGTVLTENQVELTEKAGGKFIISPDTNPNIIKRTKELGLVSIPGALTPTEITTAVRAGADFVKIFPVGSMGYNYIKDVSAPLSNVKLLAVGGVDENNMKDFLDAGACGIGIGSGIVKKKMIEESDFEGITALAKLYTSKLNG